VAGHGGAGRAGMGSGTWRKAYGVLKDSTKVGLANFNSEYKVTTMNRWLLPPSAPDPDLPSGRRPWRFAASPLIHYEKKIRP